MGLKNSRYGLFYACVGFPKCRATHGAHPDGTPLGKPATAETKKWRIRAHEAFDELWKGPKKRMTRGQAYVHMQKLMSMTADEAHIGNFDEDQCVDLIERLAIEEYGGG
jgi:ssDNA-binding Zn-finger/Zn-ribbon topoisomerase 1